MKQGIWSIAVRLLNPQQAFLNACERVNTKFLKWTTLKSGVSLRYQMHINPKTEAKDNINLKIMPLGTLTLAALNDSIPV